MIRLSYRLFFRDYQYRYQLTRLGYAWSIIRPILTCVPIILIGSQIGLSSGLPEHISYINYAFSGFIFFRIIFDAFEYPQMLSWRARKLIRSTPFPRTAVILAGMWYAFLNSIVYLLLMSVLVLLSDTTVVWSALLTLSFLPLLFICGALPALIFSPMALIYQDVRYGQPVIAAAFLWLSPIFYYPPPGSLLEAINVYNPVAYLISFPRAWLLDMPAPPISGLWLILVSTAILFPLALRFYRNAMPLVAERSV